MKKFLLLIMFVGGLLGEDSSRLYRSERVEFSIEEEEYELRSYSIQNILLTKDI